MHNIMCALINFDICY